MGQSSYTMNLLRVACLIHDMDLFFTFAPQQCVKNWYAWHSQRMATLHTELIDRVVKLGLLQ